MSEPRLGFVGLGNMGTPMAKRLVGWPGGVTVFDLRAEAVTPLAGLGASVADDVAAVAAADVICVTVLDDGQVRDVVAELAGYAKTGTVIAIHSTISPDTAVELAAALRPKGIHVVDAPVSGGGAAADKGELAIMVGADRDVYERVKPVFKRMGSMVVHAGEPGAGTRMKLARNMLTFIGFAAACEAMQLAEASGIDLKQLGRVVRHTDAQSGGPGSVVIRESMADLAPDDFLYGPLSHAAVLGEKDLRLALALGRATGVDLPLAQVAIENLAVGLGVPHRVTGTKE